MMTSFANGRRGSSSERSPLTDDPSSRPRVPLRAGTRVNEGAGPSTTRLGPNRGFGAFSMRTPAAAFRSSVAVGLRDMSGLLVASGVDERLVELALRRERVFRVRQLLLERLDLRLE